MQFLLVTVCLGLMDVTASAEKRLDATPATPSAAPTAAALSEPGALAAYVTESMKATGRCVLPAGVIKTDVPIELKRLHGGVIEGAGPAKAPCGSKSGWRSHPETIQATTTIVMNDSPPPVIVDATGATNQARVIVDGVKVTQHGLHDRLYYSGHVYYRLPANHRKFKSMIRVRDNDMNNYPWGGVYESQVVE